MVRASKTPLPEVKNVVETEVVPKVKKPSEKKSKKTVLAVDPVLVDPVVVVDPVVMVVDPVMVVVDPVVLTETEVVPEVMIDTIPTKMLEFGLKLQQIMALMTSTKVHFKLLEKVVAKDFKINQKATSKKSKRSGNRKPSGFVRPTLISDELANFLGKPTGTEMARTAVSKEINQYIRTNDLQEKTNGRLINADVALCNLLQLSKDDVLSYFNLQRYLKHHFIKTVPTEPLVVSIEA